MHDLYLACERGCSKAVKKELSLRGITGKTEVRETSVIIKDVKQEDIVKAAYLLQTPMRIGLLLGEAEVSVELEEAIVALEVLIGNIDYESYVIKDKTVAVHCHREGTHDYNSVDMSQAAGRALRRQCKEQLGWAPEADFKKPDITFLLDIDEEEATFCLDLTGRDVAKRAYKIFNNPHSIKGPLAASALLLAGWEPGQTLLDPYTSGGTLPIEAALLATGTSLHFYHKDLAVTKHPLFRDAKTIIEQLDRERREDAGTILSFDAQLRNVTAAKKNAKIAGIDKSITFSKMDVEWLETKLDPESVDRLVCQPVEASKHVNAGRAKRLQQELFDQAMRVLTKKGTLTFICQRPEDLIAAGEQYGYAPIDQQQVFAGKLSLWLLSFSKKR